MKLFAGKREECCCPRGKSLSSTWTNLQIIVLERQRSSRFFANCFRLWSRSCDIHAM